MMPTITLDKFIQENRKGLDPDGLPNFHSSEDKQVALAYLFKKPLIVEGWVSHSTSLYDCLKDNQPWERFPRLRFVWATGGRYEIDFYSLSPVIKRKLRAIAKGWEHRPDAYYHLDALSQVLYTLGYELQVKRAFGNVLMANVSF